jgi:trans-2,3-dihydro-3-hydroxyanthranilate isomerase
MTTRAFRLLNVFAIEGVPFSGNPLAIVEDGEGLSDDDMQALARQFNLSETTFILPPTSPDASARVRIFTPTFEMPFAGHPTLGTAQVVRDLKGAMGTVTLEMKAGLVEVTAEGAHWTLRAAQPPTTRAPAASREALADMLGLDEADLGHHPLWVDTGAEQLVLPLTSVDAVHKARPRADLLATHGFSDKRGASMAYVWAKAEGSHAVARFFFLSNGSVIEDPATGSACANLGGYLLATETPLPVRLELAQGEAVKRPSRLGLYVDLARRIFVTGAVVPFARGELSFRSLS